MISLIITNYKTWDLTERCVKSVDKTDSTKQITEIIIVDDNSEEPIPDHLLNNTLVKIIINGQNKGYAKSVNIGFDHAINDICLLLDSDAYLISPISQIINDFDKQSDLGVLGFNLVDENNIPTGRGEKETDVWSIILGQKTHSIFEKYLNKNKDLITLYSCAIAIRKQAFKEVRGFDEEFDFTDADQDFCMKINRTKWTIGINEKIKIYHNGGGSPQKTSKRVFRFYKNRFMLLKKHNLIKSLFIVKTITSIRLFIELLLLSILGRFKFQKEIWKDKLKSRKEVLCHLKNF